MAVKAPKIPTQSHDSQPPRTFPYAFTRVFEYIQSCFSGNPRNERQYSMYPGHVSFVTLLSKTR